MTTSQTRSPALSLTPLPVVHARSSHPHPLYRRPSSVPSLPWCQTVREQRTPFVTLPRSRPPQRSCQPLLWLSIGTTMVERTATSRTWSHQPASQCLRASNPIYRRFHLRRNHLEKADNKSAVKAPKAKIRLSTIKITVAFKNQ